MNSLQRGQRLGICWKTHDFGDGSGTISVKSDGNVNSLAKDRYAVTQHRFARPGDYLVRVERTNENGQKATAHLHVPVGPGFGAATK